MRVTLLGSGDAVGVPAPLCDCRYCADSDRRRRPALLIGTEDTTVVLDAGPDLKEQLVTAGGTDAEAVFVTHHHFDHVGGLQELNHAAMPFETHMRNPEEFGAGERPPEPAFAVHLTERAAEHLEAASPLTTGDFDTRRMEHGTRVTVGDLDVVPFPVDHARPAFDTLGFAVYHDGTKLVYAPDLKRFLPDATAGREYEDADLLFVEGSGLFRAETHGPGDALAGAIEDAGADRTVLVNLNEHLQRCSTDELEERATAMGYECGRDFATYEL